MFHFGMAAVQKTRTATAEDLETTDLTRLVCACQDVWHVNDRIMRQVSKRCPDYNRLRGRVSQVMERASRNFGLIEADTPAELQQRAEAQAMILQNNILGLIAEFRTAVLTLTKQERIHTRMEQLGVCYDKQHHSDTAAESPTPPHAHCIETAPIMYGRAAHFKCVDRFDVRFTTSLS